MNEVIENEVGLSTWPYLTNRYETPFHIFSCSWNPVKIWNEKLICMGSCETAISYFRKIWPRIPLCLSENRNLCRNMNHRFMYWVHHTHQDLVCALNFNPTRPDNGTCWSKNSCNCVAKAASIYLGTGGSVFEQKLRSKHVQLTANWTRTSLAQPRRIMSHSFQCSANLFLEYSLVTLLEVN